MRNMLLLILNTLKVTLRKKGNILVYLVLPLSGVLLSLAIYSGAGGSRPLSIGIDDRDKSSLSRDFIAAFNASGGYTSVPVDEAGGKKQLLESKVQAVITIPSGYGEGIYGGKPQKMDVLTIRGEDTTVWLEQFINTYTRNLSDLSAASSGDKTVFDRIYAEYKANQLKLTETKLDDQQRGRQMTMTSVGFLLMFVMLGAGFTSNFILNEKRDRTYYRICSAPVSPWIYIAGNAITSLLIVAMQIVLLQLVMKYVVHIETYVPALVMFLILLVFGIAAIGVSLLVTAFSSSSYMASTLNSLVVTPTCMLGGCFWPVEYMPQIMRKIAYFTPQRWALEGIQKVQTGTGLEGIMMNLVIMLAFAAALLVIAIYKFSRTNSLQRFV